MLAGSKIFNRRGRNTVVPCDQATQASAGAVGGADGCQRSQSARRGGNSADGVCISSVTVSKSHGAAVGNVPGRGTLFSDCARDIGSIDNRRSAHAEHNVVSVTTVIADGELISSNYNDRSFRFSGKDSRYSITAIIGNQSNGITSLRGISGRQRERERGTAQVKRPCFIDDCRIVASQDKGHTIITVQGYASKQIDLSSAGVGNPEMIIPCRVYRDFLASRKRCRDGNLPGTGSVNFATVSNT